AVDEIEQRALLPRCPHDTRGRARVRAEPELRLRSPARLRAEQLGDRRGRPPRVVSGVIGDLDEHAPSSSQTDWIKLPIRLGSGGRHRGLPDAASCRRADADPHRCPFVTRSSRMSFTPLASDFYGFETKLTDTERDALGSLRSWLET